MAAPLLLDDAQHRLVVSTCHPRSILAETAHVFPEHCTSIILWKHDIGLAASAIRYTDCDGVRDLPVMVFADGTWDKGIRRSPDILVFIADTNLGCPAPFAVHFAELSVKVEDIRGDNGPCKLDIDDIPFFHDQPDLLPLRLSWVTVHANLFAGDIFQIIQKFWRV